MRFMNNFYEYSTYSKVLMGYPPPPQPELSYTSRPLLKIATWRYWFRLSRDVYDGNRSFASYTKTKTVESDV